VAGFQYFMAIPTAILDINTAPRAMLNHKNIQNPHNFRFHVQSLKLTFTVIFISITARIAAESLISLVYHFLPQLRNYNQTHVYLLSY
jgi:hypothetical protein